MHKTGNCLAKGACQNSVTSVNPTPSRRLLRVMKRTPVLSAELPSCSPDNWRNGRLGRFLFFCAVRDGEMFDQVLETFSKFEKNKMRRAVRPWKVPQGSVQKIPAVLGCSRARDVRDAEVLQSGGPAGTLRPSSWHICCVTVRSIIACP